LIREGNDRRNNGTALDQAFQNEEAGNTRQNTDGHGDDVPLN
jgi:hypothetical protein